MKSPEEYLNEARHCRRDGAGLAIFAAACAIALILIGGGLAGTSWWWLPLALLCGLLSAAAGAVCEFATARQLGRLADQEATFQPLERI